jgi:hypothetical protein
MLSRDLAIALHDAGLTWSPTNGDQFVILDRDLDDEVFVLSNLVIEQVTQPDGTQVLAFNGTTEWALDALEASEAVWVPREAQLRDQLGDAFEGLQPLPPPTGGYAVVVGGRRHVDTSAENAYARALLALLAGD